LTGRVQLSLYYDANNNGIAESEERLTFDSNFNAASVSINQTLGAGIYFIVVEQTLPTSNTTYTLNLTGTAVTGIQPTIDPGETIATAFNIGVLSGSRVYRQFVGVVDPIDTYRFTLLSPTTFGATLSGLTGRVLVSLYFDANNNGVIDSANERLFSESNFGAASVALNRPLNPGTYFIEIAAFSSNTAYTLNLGA
jgi:hypothetical protein